MGRPNAIHIQHLAQVQEHVMSTKVYVPYYCNSVHSIVVVHSLDRGIPQLF